MKIVAISDQHGHLPRIPPCDLLIVAGDVVPDYPKGYTHRAADELWSDAQKQQQADWFKNVWLPWRNGQPALVAGVTWGNHDWFATDWGHGRRYDINYCDPETGRLTYIEWDRQIVVRGLNIWLTPWSRTFMRWAFMKDEDQLAEVYARIPEGTDILVTHQPPYGVCDTIPGVHADDCPLRYHLGGPPEACTCGCETHLGSKALLAAIERIKPRVVICGHIHNGFGRETLYYKAPAFADRKAVTVYNVSVVDEGYHMVHEPTEIEL